jgi:hypothetical protein
VGDQPLGQLDPLDRAEMVSPVGGKPIGQFEQIIDGRGVAGKGGEIDSGAAGRFLNNGRGHSKPPCAIMAVIGWRTGGGGWNCHSLGWIRILKAPTSGQAFIITSQKS